MLLATVAHAQGVIGTFAGTDFLFPFEPMPALSAPLGTVQDVALDASGNLYISDRDNHIVVRADVDGGLGVFAGNGLAGFSGDGGLAINASMQQPLGLAIDGTGNVYISDSAGNRVRKVDENGVITTVAGNGMAGFTGDGSATANELNQPAGLAIDTAGNLYIADSGNNRVRKVTPAGLMTTLAANLNAPAAVKVDQTGKVYVATTDSVQVIMLDGTISTLQISVVAGLLIPAGLAFDGQGNLYVSNAFNSQVLQFAPNGSTTIIAGNGQFGFSGDDGPATKASLNSPRGLAVNPAGIVYIADRGNLRVRAVGVDGNIRTVAGDGNYRFSGDGQLAIDASLQQPIGVATDSVGNVYIADLLNNRVRKVTTDGVINTVAGNGMSGYSGDGGAATGAALKNPHGVSVDNTGFYIADSSNNVVRKVDLQGIIRTFAGGGQANGSPATQATLLFPSAVAADGLGDLYIADEDNNLIREVMPDLTIKTVAGGGNSTAEGVPATSAALNAPEGVAIDNQGRLFISDTDNNQIRMVLNGVITTIAGGGTATGENVPATSARVDSPVGLAVDNAGNLYYAEFGANRVRRVANGSVVTVAGTLGQSGYAGDGGLAVDALLNGPQGVALDAAGNLYIADGGNNRIRKVLATPPKIDVSPLSLSFSGVAGGLLTAPQLISISSNDLSGLPFSVSLVNNSPWLNVFPTAGPIPASLQISADPSGLQAGPYNETIHIETLNADPSSTDVQVEFTVANPGQPLQSVQPVAFSFAFVLNSPQKTQTLTVANLGGGTLTFSIQATNAGPVKWLSVDPTSGTATPTAPALVNVIATPGQLPQGTYTGTINITLSSGAVSPIPVTMTISSVPNSIRLSQTGLTFTAVAGGGVVPPQSFSVLNTGLGVMNWTASVVAPLGQTNFLSLSPATGLSDAASLFVPSVTVTASAAGFQAGAYYSLIEVDSPTGLNSPQYIPVVMEVLQPGQDPGPAVEPSELVFTGIAGEPPPSSQNLLIYNLKGSPLSYRSQKTTANGINWIVYLPTEAAVDPQQPTRLVVQPDTTLLPPGIQEGVLTMSFTDGSTRKINVLAVVLPPGNDSAQKSFHAAQAVCTSNILVLGLTTLPQNFIVPAGYPTALDVTVVDNCGNPISEGSVQVSFSDGEPELALLSLRNGQWTGTWTPSQTPASITLTITAQTSNGLKKSLVVGGGTRSSQGTRPRINSGGVVNAANYAPSQPLAPGDMIAVFGSMLASEPVLAPKLPLDTTLAGTSIIIGGQLLPLLYVGPGQLNAILPYGLNPNTSYPLIVSTQNLLSDPEQVVIAGAQPVIFKTSLGPAILGANGAILSTTNPAHAGDVLMIYATGLGAVNGDVILGAASGAIATAAPLSASIGNMSATVQYAGLAPGFVGLYQVNVQVPSGIEASDSVPLVLTIGGQTSPEVQIPIR